MIFFKRFIIFLGVFYFFISCNNKKNIDTDNSELSPDKIEIYLKNARDPSKTIAERKENLSKANNLVQSLSENKIKITKLLDISIEHYELEDWKNYKIITQQALKLSSRISDSLKIAKSLGFLAIYYRDKQLDSAYKYYHLADKIYTSFDKRNLYKSTEYSFDQGRTLIDLAKLSRKIKDYNESESFTIKAIEKFKLSGNLEYIPLSYSNLGIIAKQLERYDDALKYNSKAIEYAKNTKKDTLYITLMHNNTGTIYKSQKKYSKAEKEYLKGLSYVDFLNSRPKRYARYIDNLGYVKFLANKDNDSALYLLKKAYKIRDSIDDIVGISTSNLHLAEYYQSKNNNYSSKEFAEKAKQAAITNNENTELLQAYDLLAQVSPPEEGRMYAMKYIQLSDSLTKRDNQFRDKFARIRFETEQKEEQIQEKEKQIKQSEQQIVEVQNQNTVYLLGILLLATFIGFIIYFSRQRTKYLAQQNKIVEFQAAYETETRISKRLHDEIGNDIFQVMMQYQNDPHDPQITKKLNTAYTKARDISRENSEFEVDETYLEELTDMLTNYTKNNIRLVLRGIDKISWDTVNKNLKITIYRVLQELMTNMQKHSQADLVAIVFKNEKNKLLIKYSDNGVGIQKEDIKSKNGLRNTEKRMLAINGTIVFDSEKNKGFKAEIVIPN